MPTYHDSIDFQMCDRIFDYTSSIQIIRMHRIRDIAMDKYLSRLAVTHSRFWDAAICAADPQNLRCLALGEEREGVGIACGSAFLVGEVAS